MTILAYNLSSAADPDLFKIIHYTNENYGEKQILRYIQQLESCVAQILNNTPIAKRLPQIHPYLSYIHCQHHYIFGLMKSSAPFLVIAIFHHKMDIINRIKERL